MDFKVTVLDVHVQKNTPQKKKLGTLSAEAEIGILVMVHECRVLLLLFNKRGLDKFMAEDKRLLAAECTRCQQREGNEFLCSGTTVRAGAITSYVIKRKLKKQPNKKTNHHHLHKPPKNSFLFWEAVFVTAGCRLAVQLPRSFKEF